MNYLLSLNLFAATLYMPCILLITKNVTFRGVTIIIYRSYIHVILVYTILVDQYEIHPTVVACKSFADLPLSSIRSNFGGR